MFFSHFIQFQWILDTKTLFIPFWYITYTYSFVRTMSLYFAVWISQTHSMFTNAFRHKFILVRILQAEPVPRFGSGYPTAAHPDSDSDPAKDPLDPAQPNATCQSVWVQCGTVSADFVVKKTIYTTSTWVTTLNRIVSTRGASQKSEKYFLIPLNIDQGKKDQNNVYLNLLHVSW